MSTYRLTLATEATRDLVVEALRAEASRRSRVATKASLTVAEDKLAKRDVRSAAVRVTGLLAEAAQLGQLADELAAAEALPIVDRVPPLAVAKPELEVDLTKLDDPTPLDVAAAMLGVDAGTGEPVLEEDPDDDGLSPAAHAIAELAGLDDALLDEDDPTLDTGATAEDDEPDAADTNALEEGLKP